MTPDEIRQIADQLAASHEDKPPRLQASELNPPDTIRLSGNRSGLIALARALLLAAASPASTFEEREVVQVEEEDIWVLDRPNDVAIGYIEHRDVVPPSPEELKRARDAAWRNDRGCLLGCAAIGFVLLFLMVSGIILWVGIFLGNPRFMP